MQKANTITEQTLKCKNTFVSKHTENRMLQIKN